MATSLLDIFNVGRYEDLSTLLRVKYIESDDEERRRSLARERIALYEDRGKPYLDATIERVIGSHTVRRKLKKFSELALAHNLTKRIINELSVVYQDTAERKVSNGQEAYQQVLLDMRFNLRMRTMNRYTNLANHTLNWFYVIERGEEIIPALETITPDNFYAIADPVYPTQIVGFIVDQTPTGPNPRETDRHYVVLSGAEFFHLDKKGRFVPGTLQENPYGRLPAVLASKSQPREGVLDTTSGNDIIRAHKASALQQVYLLADQKSGQKVGYASGEMVQNAIREQVFDKENLLLFPQGTQVGTLDLGAEPDAIVAGQNAVLQQAGAAYGLPLDLLNQNYQATSGHEINLKRIGLRERRQEQIVYCRDTERELADVMSVVLDTHAPELAFDASDWSIDFGEYEVPVDPVKEQQLFESRRNALVTSTPEFLRKQNPDITLEDARAKMVQNAIDEGVRIDLQTRANASLESGLGDDAANDNAAGNEKNDLRSLAKQALEEIA